MVRWSAATVSGSLEKLDFALVSCGSGEGGEGPQVPPPPGLSVFLSRVEPILSGFQFANHGHLRCRERRSGFH